MTDADNLAALQSWAADLERRQLAKRHASRGSIWKPTATAATLLGYECERRIVYQRVIPWAAEPVSPELASIFQEGRQHERQVFQELEDDLGVELRNRNATFRDDSLEIAGQLDAEANVPGVGWVPVEVKGLAFIPGDSVEGVDLASGPTSLLQRYYAQLQIYLFLRGRPLGLFIFKSKVTGRWRCVAVALDYDRAEVLLKRAERVRDAVRDYVAAFEFVRPFTQDGPADSLPVDDPGEDGSARWGSAMRAAEIELPDRIPTRSECPGCPFRGICNPADAPVDPALLVDDAALVADLEALEKARPERQHYEKTYETVRARFALTAGREFYAGPFKVEKAPHGKSWRLKITRQQEDTDAAERE
jgi:hypothetical protein